MTASEKWYWYFVFFILQNSHSLFKSRDKHGQSFSIKWNWKCRKRVSLCRCTVSMAVRYRGEVKFKVANKLITVHGPVANMFNRFQFHLSAKFVHIRYLLNIAASFDGCMIVTCTNVALICLILVSCELHKVWQ